MTRRGGLRVLVIDDEPEIGRSLGDFLSDLGHEVRLAPGADAALAGRDPDWADLALVDILMPGTDGLGFLAAAAARWPRLAVIMISGIMLEGAKILSSTVFQSMVQDYMVQPDEEQIRALSSYWVEDFGLVAPGLKEPFDPKILQEGKTIHEMSFVNLDNEGNE